jgi:hypothetical protein
MSNPLVPVTGGTQNPPPAAPINSQEVGFLVRNWVHYDNLATGLYRQTVNARKVRDEFETKILDSLRASNMENAVIQIAGGRLLVQQERHNQPLTLTRIEEILHTYYTSRNMPDDSANILKFMKKQRGFEIVKKLRKQAGPSPSALPPPPPPGEG